MTRAEKDTLDYTIWKDNESLLEIYCLIEENTFASCKEALRRYAIWMGVDQSPELDRRMRKEYRDYIK